jgi:hypothetical protein
MPEQKQGACQLAKNLRTKQYQILVRIGVLQQKYTYGKICRYTGKFATHSEII